MNFQRSLPPKNYFGRRRSYYAQKMAFIVKNTVCSMIKLVASTEKCQNGMNSSDNLLGC